MIAPGRDRCGRDGEAVLRASPLPAVHEYTASKPLVDLGEKV
jgi:hypothetical protein